MKRISEDKIQQECVVWFNNNYCLKDHVNRGLVFAVPNGGSRNAIEGNKFKNTGVLAGVSDLIVMLPNKVLFIELKTSTGRQSNEQKDFEIRTELLGFKYYLCRSLEQFKQTIHAEAPQP